MYSATLMMTDNVFIYMFYQVFVAMMMCTGRPEWEYFGLNPGALRPLNDLTSEPSPPIERGCVQGCSTLDADEL